jgi:hypothetical protein
LTGRERRVKDILQQQRAGEGSTFFGKEGRELSRRLRFMSQPERMAYWATHPGDFLNYVSNVAEMWPRTAMALHLLDHVERGDTLVSKVPTRFPIAGLSPEEQIGVIVRNTFVDPQAVSETYQKWFRRKILPFVTWYHRTAEYHASYVVHNKMESVAKILGPYAGAWIWNNIYNRDREKNISPWVQHFLFHFTIRDPKPNDPNHNFVVVIPTGMDVLLNLIDVPAMSEKLARIVNHEDANPFDIGWTDAGRSMLHLLYDDAQQVWRLSPLGEILEGVISNVDPRSGRQIVDKRLWNDQARKWGVMGPWVAAKLLPWFDRMVHYASGNLRKDPTWLDKMLGGGGGYRRKQMQDIAASWLNPLRELVYDVPSDWMRTLRDKVEIEKSRQDVAQYDLEQAVSKVLQGQTEPLENWITSHPDIAPGKLDSLTAIRTFYQDQLEHAANDEQRAGLQQLLQLIDMARNAAALKQLPAPARGTVTGDVLKRQAGEPSTYKTPGLFGEAGSTR